MSLFSEISRGWHGERYAYLLPEQADVETVPSRLVVADFGTLRLERTRLDDAGKSYRIPDDADRFPMFLQRTEPQTPAPAPPATRPLLANTPRQEDVDWLPMALACAGTALMTAGLLSAAWVATPGGAAGCAAAMALGLLLFLGGWGIFLAGPEHTPLPLEPAAANLPQYG